MNETVLRRFLLIVAAVGLATGLIVPYTGLNAVRPAPVWTIATLPAVIALAISILRDLWIGRLGVDAIALVSMSAALALGQPLAAVVVAIMYSGGTVLEDFARGRAEHDLTLLSDKSPRDAHRLSGGATETIPADQICVGDELLVQAGELLPVDGILIDALASIDESAVTGEPLPEKRVRGDVLRSGTTNAGEAFRMRASAVASQSTYAAIVRMVAAAQTAKAPFIRMADRFAVIMLPATLIFSAIAWYFSGDPVRALAVLVVATPCPLILAAPVAFIGGISRSAQIGVLMKGSAALEALAKVRTVIFDKTGTLTHGGTELIYTDVAPDVDQNEVIRLLASLEQASHHVLAETIVVHARRMGLTLFRPDDVREHRGSGLEGIVDGIAILAGSQKLVLANNPLPKWAKERVDHDDGQALLRVFVALDSKLAALFTFGDTLRPDALDTLNDLRSAGLSRRLMLTGDDDAAASHVAKALGIDSFFANATPTTKVAVVKAEQLLAPTMMVGDGINDAPALATATVGVAVGVRGATASSQAADIVLLSNRLQPLADAVLIAQRTRSIAWQSIVVGLTLSGVAMIAAAFGMIAPVGGAILQEFIDVAVILNALRTLREGDRANRPVAIDNDQTLFEA
ncbi:heavy metal translocating P-type ATPase [Methylovirgula sp. 4M-Z18]|uniref:heavy metal translocating P-type ATPase n=1 Tax=Methylovirgula sp. 4M-Z18 TaxID=2293567 RepID=UPI000E2F7C95|nr:heavy metal translocating P-type ATPase [Methylovirgula sp. 4M-Z18]RFB76435.1 heavy metal translocating P-type ATPase [Methylovirgula sp. 4M-Z18]